MMDWFATKRLNSAESRLDNIEQWRDWFNWKVKTMSAELDALKAAVAADAEMDAKFVAAVDAMVLQVKDLSDKLAALAAAPVVDPVEVQAVADALNAHVADMATHLPPTA
jgi:hypothetical protein